MDRQLPPTGLFKPEESVVLVRNTQVTKDAHNNINNESNQLH